MEGHFVQLKEKLFAETSTITPNLVQSRQTERNLLSHVGSFRQNVQDSKNNC